MKIIQGAKQIVSYSRFAFVLVVALVVSACTAAPVQIPDRAITISTEEALAGQNALFAVVTTGEAEVTETQFSSLLTKLLEANSGANNPITQITTWIEPGQLHIRVNLKEGVLPATLGNTLDLVGDVKAENGALKIELDEAAAGQLQVSGTLLQPIADQINAVLAQQAATLPLSVSLESEVLKINLAQ